MKMTPHMLPHGYLSNSLLINYHKHTVYQTATMYTPIRMPLLLTISAYAGNTLRLEFFINEINRETFKGNSWVFNFPHFKLRPKKFKLEKYRLIHRLGYILKIS